MALADDVTREIKEDYVLIKAGTYLPLFRRHAYKKITEFLSDKQIIAITGLRQVGKTTLLKQIAHDHQEFDTWYLSVDSLTDKTPQMLNEVIYYFIKNSNNKPLIIIDEIQKIESWAEVIKKFYDRQPIKFLLSGSASLQITKGKESLAGRLVDIYLPPLTFAEFLELSGIDIKNQDLSILSERLSEAFIDYCFKGGLPELALEKNLEKLRLIVENNTVNKIIYEDIPEVFNIRNRALLFKLFKHACEATGNLFDYSTLGSIYGASKDTVREYLFYLEQSFLLFETFKFAKGISKRERNLKKLYVVHSSIAVQMLHLDRNIFDTELAGRFVETAVFNHIKNLFEEIYVWRDEQKREVDFFVNEKYLIEVKYQSRIIGDDTKNMNVAIRNLLISHGIVVTKNTYNEKNEIKLIPAWRFLLMDQNDIDSLFKQ